MKKEKILEPTKEQIDAWKLQYGGVTVIEVAEAPDVFDPTTMSKDLDELPKMKGYLKKPDRKINNFALAMLGRNMIGAGKAILKDCWLGGDERILNDETYSTAAAIQAIELVEVFQTRLKKL